MKKIILTAALCATSALFADCRCNLATCSTNGTPYIQKTVRSALGKELDGVKAYAILANAQIAQELAKLNERLAKLEAVESNRVARVEAARQKREERQAKKVAEERSKTEILRDAIRRGKRVQKKEAK